MKGLYNKLCLALITMTNVLPPKRLAKKKKSLSHASYEKTRRHETNQTRTRPWPEPWKSQRGFAVNGSQWIMRALTTQV